MAPEEPIYWDWEGWAVFKAAVIITVMTVLIGVVSLAFCVYDHFFAREQTHERSAERDEETRYTSDDDTLSTSFVFLPGYRRCTACQQNVSVWTSQCNVTIPSPPSYEDSAGPCPAYV